MKDLKYASIPEVWEDLVKDFLEMACFLRAEEQEFLMQELRRQRIATDSIEVHPCFSINGKAIIICETGDPKECWLYVIKNRLIRRCY